MKMWNQKRTLEAHKTIVVNQNEFTKQSSRGFELKKSTKMRRSDGSGSSARTEE